MEWFAFNFEQDDKVDIEKQKTEYFFSNPEMFREIFLKNGGDINPELMKKATETADKLKMSGIVKSEVETKHASNR